MRIGRFVLDFKRTPKPLPPEVVTSLSLLNESIASLNAWQKGIDDNVKETRTRLERVYRKVYRDEAKGDGDQVPEDQPRTLPLPQARDIRAGEPPPG